MADKLSLDGSLPMTGPLDMAGQDIVNTGIVRPRDTGADDLGSATKRYKTIHLSEEIKGPTYSRLADDIISLAPFPVSAGNIPFFNTADGRTLRDIGLSSDKLMLTDGTAIMTGDLDMNNVSIKNTANIRPYSDSASDIGQDGVFYRTVFTRKIQGIERIETRDDDCNVRIGSGTTLTDGGSNVRNVWLGFDQTGSGFGLTMIGDSNTQTTGPGPAYIIGSGNSIDGSDCSIIGGTNNFVNGNRQFSYVNGNSNHVTGSFCVVTGTLNTAAGDEAIIFGDNSTAQNRAIAIGFSANNDQDDTCLIGGTGILNIRPNSLTCDLGTRAAPFQSVIAGNVHTDQYATYADVVVANTTTETDISTNASSRGSLLYVAPTPLGMIAEVEMAGIASSVAGDTLSIAFQSNGATIFVVPIVVPALSANKVLRLNVRASVRAASLKYYVTGFVGTSLTNIQDEKAFDPSIDNTFGLTATWGANVNSFTLQTLSFQNLFRF